MSVITNKYLYPFEVKLKRQNTPYPTRQSIIDLDEGTIEIKSNFDNVDYEYLPNSSILHGYKKE